MSDKPDVISEAVWQSLTSEARREMAAIAKRIPAPLPIPDQVPLPRLRRKASNQDRPTFAVDPVLLEEDQVQRTAGHFASADTGTSPNNGVVACNRHGNRTSHPSQEEVGHQSSLAERPLSSHTHHTQHLDNPRSTTRDASGPRNHSRVATNASLQPARRQNPPRVQNLSSYEDFPGSSNPNEPSFLNNPLPPLPGDNLNRGRTMNRGGSSQTTHSSIGLGRPSSIPRSARSMSQPLPGAVRRAATRPQLPSIPDEDPVNNITAVDESHSILDKLDQVLARLDLVAASGSNDTPNNTQVSLPHSGHPQSGNHTTGRRGRARNRTTRSASRAGRPMAARVDVGDLDIGDGYDSADESEVEGVVTAHMPLNRTEERTRRDMQKYVTRQFRFLCGMVATEAIPTLDDLEPGETRVNETTGEPYHTLDMMAGVKDFTNSSIIDAITSHIFHQFEADPGSFPKQGHHHELRWNWDCIQRMTKNSFRSVKTKFQRQRNNAAAERRENADAINRRYMRMKRKAQARAAAISLYQEKYPETRDTDMKQLVDWRHMSGDESSPERDSGESKEQFIQRLGEIQNLTPEELEGYQCGLGGRKIVAVVTPLWRSQELQEVHHELDRLWTASLTTAQHNKFKILPVYGTRASADIPKDGLAPFNFGINPDWWARIGQPMRDDPSREHFVAQFYAYPDPVGFGSNVIVA